MRAILTSITLAALLSGCTNKGQTELLTHYEKNKHYHKELLKTEKVQLYENNLTKVALTATYLDSSYADQNSTNDERFIIGLYVDDEIERNNAFDFNLTLNGMEPKSIVPLKHTDKRLKDISFVSDWSNYFLVTFPHVSAKRFKLVFESDTYGKGVLDFAKRAKYTFTKKAF